jgi:hypothetical protein
VECNTLERLHAEWLAARDELRAFEQRLGVFFQGISDREIPAPNLPMTSDNVKELKRLVE